MCYIFRLHRQAGKLLVEILPSLHGIPLHIEIYNNVNDLITDCATILHWLLIMKVASQQLTTTNIAVIKDKYENADTLMNQVIKTLDELPNRIAEQRREIRITAEKILPICKEMSRLLKKELSRLHTMQ